MHCRSTSLIHHSLHQCRDQTNTVNTAKNTPQTGQEKQPIRRICAATELKSDKFVSDQPARTINTSAGLTASRSAEPTDRNERTLLDGLCSLLMSDQRSRTTNTIKEATTWIWSSNSRPIVIERGSASVSSDSCTSA